MLLLLVLSLIWLSNGFQEVLVICHDGPQNLVIKLNVDLLVGQVEQLDDLVDGYIFYASTEFQFLHLVLVIFFDDWQVRDYLVQVVYTIIRKLELN